MTISHLLPSSPSPPRRKGKGVGSLTPHPYHVDITLKVNYFITDDTVIQREIQESLA